MEVIVIRIDRHPIIDLDRGEKVTIYYNGQPVEAYSNETVAAALYAAGIRKLNTSSQLHRPRGIFCAIGNCAGCYMTVDGVPNMRVCVIKCRDGMQVQEQQQGKGGLQI